MTFKGKVAAIDRLPDPALAGDSYSGYTFMTFQDSKV